MEDFRAKISKLRSFFEVQLINGLCSLYESGVIVVHAVNVRPDLNLFGINCSANQRCSIVGTAALKVINIALNVSANKSLRYIYIVSLILFENVV